MSMDSLTETIAHFIGFFHTTLEHARMREAYTKFLVEEDGTPETEAAAFVQAQFDARFDLIGYVPTLDYKAPSPDTVMYYPWSDVRFTPPQVDIPGQQVLYPGWLMPKASMVSVSGSAHLVLPKVEPLGSVASVISQTAILSDNDYFGVGGHGLIFTPPPIDNQPLLDFADQALSISPIGAPAMPGSAAEMGAFIREIAERVENFTADDVPEGATVTVVRSDALEGKYLNGVAVDELPDLKDYHDLNPLENPDPAPAKGNAVVHADGTVTVDASVTVEAGGNTLVNAASVASFWTAATVTAVMGDHIEVNAIVQVNAWMDDDAVSSLIGNWTNDAAQTQAFNLATFARYDTLADMEPPAPTASFPENWVVTHIDGDVMIVNWLQQLVFMSDNDIGILSSSGSTTTVIAGENTSINQISLYEMAFAYDLIVVGGHVFDANIIQQMNVLFDNDVIGAVEGFETTGKGSVSTSDNLLWNEASIYNVGGATRFDALPDAYKAFADSLADGGQGAAGDVLNDTAFAGLGALRVLYISGDLIKLNYISQTNILGDSDQIALAMNAVGPVTDADWTVNTGGNTLINLAAIADLDSLGKTYVGGQQYSQDILVQAEFISTSPDGLGIKSPDALVNEAVAFLVDDIADHSGAGASSFDPSYHPLDAGQGDGLQSILV
ncbi:hypothetical protein [Aliihoeflea sp. PC F10.4]